MPSEQTQDGERELRAARYNCLRRHHRKQILFGLLEKNPQEALSVPPRLETENMDVESYEVQLVHRDLPVLEESGVVRWDRESGVLHKGPQFEQVRPLLAAIRQAEQA